LGKAPTLEFCVDERVSKGLILEAVREGIGPRTTAKIDGLEKDAMAKRAEALLAGKGWLPSPSADGCGWLRLERPEPVSRGKRKPRRTSSGCFAARLRSARISARSLEDMTEKLPRKTPHRLRSSQPLNEAGCEKIYVIR
jgi:hypothetical protein